MVKSVRDGWACVMDGGGLCISFLSRHFDGRPEDDQIVPDLLNSVTSNPSPPAILRTTTILAGNQNFGHQAPVTGPGGSFLNNQNLSNTQQHYASLTNEVKPLSHRIPKFHYPPRSGILLINFKT